MRMWIKNPLAILAENAAGGIVVEDARIVELVQRGKVPEHDSVFDASAHVVLPGLINTHHHFYQTLTRAHPQAINKELFDWLKALYPVWARLTPEAHRLATRLALTVEEAARIGMRMMVTRGSMNLSVKDGGLPPDSVVQDQDTILADCERVIGKYHQRGEGAMMQIALAPCSPFSVTRELMRATGEMAERLDCRLHTHLAETKDEDAFCVSQFGMRPLDYLEDCGWLNNRTWLAHGIYFNNADVQRLGKHGVSVCHCPTSNMTLASGQCRTCELEAAGVAVGLGVDGSASNDSSNLMEGVRHALLLNRLTYNAKVTHLDALRWATKGSAACLGRSDIGEIVVGKQADLALFTLDELRFSGAGDPIAALVLCGAHKADRVMVAGQWRVIDGQPKGIDVARLRSDHGKAALKFI
jgi:8-oxoguanine deaminase